MTIFFTRLFKLYLIFLSSMFVSKTNTYAQMIGNGNVFLKGRYIEIGLDGQGGFEGANYSNSGANAIPPGYHPRGCCDFGFVANPQRNNWATYDGDFFTPGVLKNGWTLDYTIGNTTTTLENKASTGSDLRGSFITYNQTSECVEAVWQGNRIGNNPAPVDVKLTYFFNTNDLFYTTIVSIRNVSTSTLSNVYWMREIDPDNAFYDADGSGGDGYTTRNKLESQPNSGVCNLAQVTARTGPSYTSNNANATYLGLAAVGPNWRVSYGGGFGTNNPAANSWNANNPYIQTVGSATTGDVSIQLTNRINTLVPNETVEFQFVTILDSSQVGNAVNNILKLNYTGKQNTSASPCLSASSIPDTIGSCNSNPSFIAITGSIANDFNWTWAPAAGLSATTGYSVTAGPPSLTTYTITGKSKNGCFADKIFNIVVKSSVPDTGRYSPIADISVCSGTTVPLKTLVTNPAAFSYSWTNSNTAIGLAGSGTGNIPSFVATNTTTTAITSTITLNAVGDVSVCRYFVPLNYRIIVNPIPTATIVGSTTLCQSGNSINIDFTGYGGNPPYNFNYSINGASSNTVTASSTSTNVVVLTNTPGTYTYSLISVSDANCTNTQSGSAVVRVNSLPTAVLSNDTMVCRGTSSVTNLVLRGSNGTSPYTFTYRLNGTLQPTVSSTSGINTASVTVPTGTAQTITYSLVSVSDGNGCSQTQSDVSVYQIKTPASGSLSAGSVFRVCQNSTPLPNINFTGSNGPSPYTFSYTVDSIVNGVYVGTTLRSVSTIGSSSVTSVSVPTSQADTLRYIITGVADNSGLTCPTTPDTAEFIIDPLPKSTISSPGGTNQCFSPTGQVQLDFTAINVVGQITFNYTTQFGATYAAALAAPKTTPSNSPLGPLVVGTNTLNDTSIFVSAGQVGTTIYSNGISSSNVCAGSGSGTYVITVNPLPTASITAVGSTTVCDNSSNVVRFTAGIGQPPFTFSYNINGGGTKQVSTAAGTYTVDLTLDTVPGTYTLNLTAVRDQYNCSQAQTGSITITVDPLPVATGVGSQTICSNSSATIVGLSASNGSISWSSNGAGTISNEITTTPTYAALSGDAGSVVTLTMTVTSTNTCNPQKSYTTYSISVDRLPVAGVSGSQTICSNGIANISGMNASNGSISWTSNGAGTIGNGNTTTPTYAAALGDAGSVITLTMTVTSTNTCNPQTAQATYSLNIDRLPLATGVGNQKICSNGSATISGLNASNGSIGWSSNGAGTISNGTTTTPTYVASLADAGSVITLTMTVTSTNTCLGQTAKTTYSISADPLPIATGVGSQTICSNATATISGVSASNGSISWSSNGGGTISNGNTITPRYVAVLSDANSLVTLTMTVSSTNSCIGETASTTYTLQADPLPESSITGSGVAICENSSYTLLPGEANQQYGTVFWSKESASGNIVNVTSLTPTYVASSLDAGTIISLRMTVTSSNSCAPATTSALYNIQIDSLPRSIKGKDTTICSDGMTTIEGAGARNGTVFWTVSNNASGILSSPSSLSPSYQAVTADAGKTIELTLTVTSNNSCGINSKSEKKHLITVRPLLTASMSLSSPVVCKNKTAQVIITAINGVGEYEFTYLESGEEKTIKTVEDNKTAIGGITLIPDSRIITLTKIKDLNCQNQVQGNQTQTLTVYDLPDATITSASPSCRGDEKQPVIVITGKNTIPPYTFEYTVNSDTAINTTIGSGSSYSLNVSTDKAEEYKYMLKKVTDLRGCSVVIYNQKAETAIYEIPQASFIIKENRKTIFEPEIEIENNSLMGKEYMWDFGDGTINFEENPQTHIYSDTGYYQIGLYVANGICNDSMLQTIRITQPTLIYVPNSFSPNNDGTNDVFMPKGEGIEKYEMFIFDRWGNTVFTSNDINKGWDGTINGSSPMVGTYVYTINIKASSNKLDYNYRGTINLIK
jgi:gliding motility-associated-like protein